MRCSGFPILNPETYRLKSSFVGNHSKEAKKVKLIRGAFEISTSNCVSSVRLHLLFSVPDSGPRAACGTLNPKAHVRFRVQAAVLVVKVLSSLEPCTPRVLNGLDITQSHAAPGFCCNKTIGDANVLPILSASAQELK